MKSLFFILFLLLFLCSLMHAELKVAPILSDNMVLQRNTEVKIWGTANANEKIIIKARWSKETIKVTSNTAGEWLVKLKTTEAGGPYSISIKSGKENLTINNILLGEVWLCSGQSNMEMPVLGYNNQPVNGSLDALLEADNDNIRLFKVKLVASPTPKTECEGSWVAANTETVGKFSAIGYFYAKILQQKLKVPVGMVYSEWGGTRIEAWMKKELVQEFPKSYELSTREKLTNNNKAAYLYNGMILPITNYCIKGALWYQGESNIDYPNEYAELMAAMIQGWRSDFSVGEFPFYFVQLAAYPYTWVNPRLTPIMRDQQTKASVSIPNAGMVTSIDHGDIVIHPAEKQAIAKRLTYLALSETYNIKGISCKSPMFRNLEIKDTLALVTFDNAQMGLSGFGKKVECFEIAGSDSIFYPADIKIVKEGLHVWSAQVKNPLIVRYAYSAFPKTEGFLYNTAGHPVIPFNTVNWLK